MFGLSFGASKSKTSSTDVLNKTEDTTQSQNTDQSQKSTGTQNTDTSSSTSSTGTSATTNKGATTGSTASTQAQTAATSSFSQDTLDALTGLLKNGIAGNGTSAASTALNSLVGQLGTFDPNKYVSDTVGAAKSELQPTIDRAIGTSDNNIGGTADTNSMAALLDAGIGRDAAKTIGGVQANAEAQAQQIIGANASTVNSAVTSQNAFLAQIAEALKGGTTTCTAATTGAETTAGTTDSTSGTTTAESSNTTGKTNTASTEDVATLIAQLLSGTTQTNATDTQKGSTTKIGGGASASM